MKICKHCNGTGKVQSALDRKRIALALKQKRLDAGVKLREVAAEIGYSIGHIHDLEQGRRFWNDDKQAAYSDAIRRLLIEQ